MEILFGIIGGAILIGLFEAIFGLLAILLLPILFILLLGIGSRKSPGTGPRR